MKKLLLLILLLFLFPQTLCAQDEPLSAERSELISRVNALRTHYGLSALEEDENLTTAAQRQADFFAEQRKLDTKGPAGESIHIRAEDSGYGGGHPFTVEEAMAKVWVDTDFEYLVFNIWKQEQLSLHALMNNSAQHIGIGIADAADKHRYILVMVAGLTDGCEDYTVIATYDFRTPKPELSSTPTLIPFFTSTAEPDGGVYHIVQEGETFSEIALEYGLDWYTLSIQNNIKLSDDKQPVILEGQKLMIHPTYTMTPTPTPTKTPLPPTITPRPTFTPDAAGVSTATMQPPHLLPPPRESAMKLRNWGFSNAKPAAIILISLSALGLIVVFTRKKDR